MFKRCLFSNGQAIKYQNTGLEFKFLVQLPWLQIKHCKVQPPGSTAETWDRGQLEPGKRSFWGWDSSTQCCKEAVLCFGKAEILQRANYRPEEGFTSPYAHPGIWIKRLPFPLAWWHLCYICVRQVVESLCESRLRKEGKNVFEAVSL